MAERPTGLNHPDMRTKKQVTVRTTDQFAKDMNLIMTCTRDTSATSVVQHAVHQLAEYYRHVIQRKMDALQEGDTHVDA